MNEKKINIGIVGAGLIGAKRAKAIIDTGIGTIVAVADKNKEKAVTLSKSYACNATDDWRTIVTSKCIDIVIVSTINSSLKTISCEALNEGKHVLCEKPLGRNPTESLKMVNTAHEKKLILKCGFNHRYHPAIKMAYEHCLSGFMGKLLFARCIYGHGGRIGYEKEWRAKKSLCGGGELLDQGVHVVDLFRYFLGDFDTAFGFVPTLAWNMEVEDNGFALFLSHSGVVAQMHTSWTQWKNCFIFEIFGEKGYCYINGLGGNYGVETLTIGKRKKDDIPSEKHFTFPGPDISWNEEWRDFINAISFERYSYGDGIDGLSANRMLEAVYKSAKTFKAEKIKKDKVKKERHIDEV